MITYPTLVYVYVEFKVYVSETLCDRAKVDRPVKIEKKNFSSSLSKDQSLLDSSISSVPELTHLRRSVSLSILKVTVLRIMFY